MKTIHKILDNYKINYPLENILLPEQALFLDIETTGFSPKTSQLYLIGCAYYKDGHWQILQWFAERYEEEVNIITEFFLFATKYKYLIHFNGNTFDLPFIEKKCQQYGLSYDFSAFEGLDIYKRVLPYKYFLKLPNCKQKTIEDFLQIQREDLFTGGELIGLYHDYVKMPSHYVEKTLLLHNSDDIKGMLDILPILTYYDLFHGQVKVKKVQANYYKDLEGVSRQELLMTLSFPVPLPIEISASANNCYFKGVEEEGQLRVPIYEEELKYFYANYKDYYYLPAEDIALHKSVGGFVDKEYRMQATAATCYTRKYSQYLPQWNYIIEPFFKREYKSIDLFFELTDEIKRDRDIFTKYAKHILDMLSDKY